MLVGSLMIDALTRSDAGDVTLSSLSAVNVNGQVGDINITGRILVRADTDGVGNENYTQGTMVSLNTTIGGPNSFLRWNTQTI